MTQDPEALSWLVSQMPNGKYLCGGQYCMCSVKGPLGTQAAVFLVSAASTCCHETFPILCLVGFSCGVQGAVLGRYFWANQ